MNKQRTVSRHRSKTIVVSVLGLAAVLGSLVLPLWSLLHENAKPLPSAVVKSKDQTQAQAANRSQQ